jgi:hypothetical protein
VASINRHFGVTNPEITFYRYLKRMRGFEGANRRFGVKNIAATFCRCLKRMRGFEGL